MSPKHLPTRQAEKSEGRNRRRIAAKYLEVAEIAATEDGTAVNVAVGVAVLSGIAAADAICIAATGERYSGQDHAAAADLLAGVDRELGKKLRVLVGMKPGSHYGDTLLTTDQRDRAIRAARDLVKAAEDRL